MGGSPAPFPPPRHPPVTTIAPDAPAPYAPPAHRPAGTPTYAPPALPAPWSPALRVGFRFSAAWLLLVTDLFGAFGQLPGVRSVAGKLGEGEAKLLEWVGARVLHTAHPAVSLPNGAGDKTVFWVDQLVTLVLAVVVAIVWTALDRRRTEYRKAHDWLRAHVRFTLGAIMLGYGAYKIVQLQFPPPMLSALIRPYGESSPMGILWKLMGHSYGYNLFTGLAEAVPAALLFWRRTTTLGALLMVAALANVVAMNLAFDVTVKGFSIQLLLMAGFLLLPELRRLWDAVVMQRAVPGRPRRELFERPRLRLATRALGTLTGLWFIGSTFWGAWSAWSQRTPDAAVPLLGIYDVESFVRNGVERPPLLTDTVRWRRLVVDRRQRATIQSMSDSMRHYRAELDTTRRVLTLFPPRDSDARIDVAYVREGDDRLRLVGVSGTDSVRALLRRIDHTRFTLLARGREFRWVQNDNFNR